MKKREPIDKRLEFANEILDLIIDSARNPLKVNITCICTSIFIILGESSQFSFKFVYIFVCIYS